MVASGFLVINKPQGYTSHQVVAELRRVLGLKRIGHTGTLDPLATGVLVVAIGAGTKLIPYLQEEKKLYRAGLILGITTNTQDVTGEVVKACPETEIGYDELEQALGKFTGSLQQIPPMYSAVKVKGQPLYKLAREGKSVTRRPRLINIYQLQAWGKTADFYRFKEGPEILVECSKGTYIRTLCHDLGEYLGCGACMGSLIRLSSGFFTLEQAYTLQEVAKAAQDNIVHELITSPVQALQHLPTVDLNQDEEKKITQGNFIPCVKAQGELSKAVSADGRLVAILKKRGQDHNAYWQPVRVVN